RALQIASVREVDEGESRVGLVVAAHAARGRAAAELVVIGVLVADPVMRVRLHPEVEVDVVGDDVPEVSVGAAGLLHDDPSLLLADDRGNDLDALGTDRGGLSRKATGRLEFHHHACRHSRFFSLAPPGRLGPGALTYAGLHNPCVVVGATEVGPSDEESHGTPRYKRTIYGASRSRSDHRVRPLMAPAFPARRTPWRRRREPERRRPRPARP